MPTPHNVVFHTSALIAYLDGDVGADEIERYLPVAVMSSVNFAEVATILVGRGFAIAEIESELRDCIPTIAPFLDQSALSAASLHARTAQFGFSLSDRASIALALSMSAPLLMVDLGWDRLDVGIEIMAIR